MPFDPLTGVFYTLHGEGRPLMICLPLMASHVEIFGSDSAAVLTGYLDRLTDSYQVLLVDYPSIGRSRDIPSEELTADRVCADLLGVATAAGFERFAYWGYSWSGAVGLQLASRTDRLSALVIGGWPPLDAPYEAIHSAVRDRIGRVEPSAMVVLRSAEQYAQWSSFYSSIVDWPEEEAVTGIRCPRMVFFGGDGDLVEAGYDIPIASAIRASRPKLERLGWSVHEIPGQGHPVTLRADMVVPIVRNFLDSV